jgi:hypothetical protein
MRRVLQLQSKPSTLLPLLGVSARFNSRQKAEGESLVEVFLLFVNQTHCVGHVRQVRHLLYYRLEQGDGFVKAPESVQICRLSNLLLKVFGNPFLATRKVLFAHVLLQISRK